MAQDDYVWLVALGPFWAETFMKALNVARYIGALLAHGLLSIAVTDPYITKPIPYLA